MLIDWEWGWGKLKNEELLGFGISHQIPGATYWGVEDEGRGRFPKWEVRIRSAMRDILKCLLDI